MAIPLPRISSLGLCAIVKNEEENMMGGISTYIDAIVPHVGLAVIVDTGSSDDTLPILLKKREQYPHLYVFSAPFGTFAKARNTSMLLAHEIVRRHHLPITHLMLLDADEKLDGHYLNVLDYTVSVMKEQQQISIDYTLAAHNTPISHTHTPPHAYAYTDAIIPRCSRAPLVTPISVPTLTSTPTPVTIASALSTIQATVSVDPLDTAGCECVFVSDNAVAEEFSGGSAAISAASSPPSSTPLPPSALTLPLSAVPLVLLSSAKFSITNVDSAGRPVPRMNAGLMNPRVLPCTAYTDPLPLIHAVACEQAIAGASDREANDEEKRETLGVQGNSFVASANLDSSDIYGHFLSVLSDIVDYSSELTPHILPPRIAAPLRITMPRPCGQRACPCTFTLASPYANADTAAPAPLSMLFTSVCFVDMVQEKRFERLVGSTVLLTAHAHTASDADSFARRAGSASWRTYTWPLPKCAYAKDLPAPPPSADALTMAALSALHQCMRQSSTQTTDGAAVSAHTSVPDTASMAAFTSIHVSTSNMDVGADTASSCTCRVPLVNFLHFVPPTAKRQAKNRAYQGAALADSLKTQRMTASLVANLPKEVQVRVRWCLLRARQRLQRWCRALLRAVDSEGEGDGNAVDARASNMDTCALMGAASAEWLQEVHRLLRNGSLDQYEWPGLLGAVTALDAMALTYAPASHSADGAATVVVADVAVPVSGTPDVTGRTDSGEACASARACDRRVASGRSRPRNVLAHTLAAYSLFSCVNASATAVPLAHALNTPPSNPTGEDGAPVQPVADETTATIAVIGASLPTRVRWVDDLGAFCIDSSDANVPTTPTSTACSSSSPWLLDLCGGRPLHTQYTPIISAMYSETHAKHQKLYAIKTPAVDTVDTDVCCADDVVIPTSTTGLPVLAHPDWRNAAVRCVSVGAGHALCLTWAAQPCDVAVYVPAQPHTPLPQPGGPNTKLLPCTVPNIPSAVLYTLSYACIRIWSPLRDMYHKLALAAHANHAHPACCAAIDVPATTSDATAAPVAVDASNVGTPEGTVLSTVWVLWRGVSHLIGIVDTHARGDAAVGVVSAAADPLFAACAEAASTLTVAHLARTPSISALSTPTHAHAGTLDASSHAVDAKAKRVAAQAWCPALPSLSATALKAQGLVGVRSAWRALQGEDKFHQPVKERVIVPSVGTGEHAGVTECGESGVVSTETSVGILTQFIASAHMRNRLAYMHAQRQSSCTVLQHTAHVSPHAHASLSPTRAEEVVCVMAPQAAFAMSAAVVATADGTLWFYEY